jgi:hypothetical protein
MEDAIYALIPIVFIIAVAGVIVLRPLSKRLGTLLEAYGQDRIAARTEERQLTAIREHLESLDRRLDMLEERMGFTEELVERGSGRPLSPGEAAGAGSQPSARLAGGR